MCGSLVQLRCGSGHATCGGTNCNLQLLAATARWKAALDSLSMMCKVGGMPAVARRWKMSAYAGMRWESCFEAKGRTRIAFEALWRPTIMYWFPLRARGWKRPVSSVNRCVSGNSWISTVGCNVMIAVGFAWWTSNGGVWLDRMCCRGWGICPR